MILVLILMGDADASSDSDSDSNDKGTGSERNLASASVSKSDEGQEDADFWIPQATRDGGLFYLNTLTGVTSSELPPLENRLSDRTPDWEAEAMNSSQFPYANRENSGAHSGAAVASPRQSVMMRKIKFRGHMVIGSIRRNPPFEPPQRNTSDESMP